MKTVYLLVQTSGDYESISDEVHGVYEDRGYAERVGNRYAAKLLAHAYHENVTQRVDNVPDWCKEFTMRERKKAWEEWILRITRDNIGTFEVLEYRIRRKPCGK